MTSTTFSGLPLVAVDNEEEDYGRWLLHGPQGSGKRVPVETPILTPNGWVAIGDLIAGDQVIGVDGEPHTVYGVTAPVIRPTYRLVFNDGATVDADGEHLWEVRNRKGNRMVLDTEQIVEGIERGGTYTIPRMAAAQHPEADLPLDPFILGSLIADGYLTGRTVHWTKNREQTVAEFRSRLGGLDAVDEQPSNYARRQRFRDPDGVLRKMLDYLGLRVASGEKFIPEQYLVASEQQRLDLLAGLFDGDGRLSGKGQPLYHTTSRRLAEDVQRLVWSLGAGANIQQRKTDGTWAVGITSTHLNPFRTAEHTDKVNDQEAYYDEARRIESVTSIGETEGRCIAVDAPRSLYVMKDYIVTHNTTLASTVAELGKTLFIDLVGEKGTRSFRGAPYAANIDVIRPLSVTDLDDLFWTLKRGDHPYKAVVIDSLTAVQKMTMRYLLGHDETAVREIKQGTAPADIRTWGQALDVMVDTATFWYGLADGNNPSPMHVVMTAQTKVTENEETGTMTRTPDVQKGALSITLAAPDYIVYCDVEDNMDAVADDTLPPVHHIVRFGSNPDYRTKARLPYRLRGKIPPVLGRKNPPSLAQLSRLLGTGGAPKVASGSTGKKSATTTEKE